MLNRFRTAVSWARVRAGVLIILILLSLGSCRPGSGEQIILFVIKDQSDTMSLNPTRLETAAQLALEQHTRDTGDTAAHPRHHFISYTGDEAIGAELARDFILENPDVVALVGDISSTGTRLLANVAQELEVPHLSFFATDESIFGLSEWSFSYRERVSHETDALLFLIEDHLVLERPLLIVNDLTNLVPRWREVGTALEESGIRVSGVVEVPRDSFDFTDDIERIVEDEFNADGVVSFLTADQTEHMLQQFTRAGVSMPVLLSGVVLDYENLVDFAGLDLDIYSFAFEHTLRLHEGNDELLTEFARRYQLSMGVRRVDSLGPWIFDGIMMLHECLDEHSTRVELRDALSRFDEERMVGNVRFDETGSLPERTFRLIRLEAGSIVPIEERS